jgi:hypothetical protein
LLAAAFEVLGFELLVFVIRLGERLASIKESRHLKLQNVSFLPGSRIASLPIHALGQVSDCSGRSPAIRINAMSNIPAQLLSTNATNNHEAKAI